MASYRPITEEIPSPTTVGTATTVSNADVVRAVNTTATNYLLTVVSQTGDVIGSMTLTPAEKVFIKKRESDKIYAENAGIRVTRITYPVM